MTVIEASPDGGQQAAFFPELNNAVWTHKVEARIEAVDGVPAYRYEQWQCIEPPRTL
jgi:hypothetical protein